MNVINLLKNIKDMLFKNKEYINTISSKVKNIK